MFSPYVYTCECGGQIDSRTQRLWYAVEGWTHARAQGGPNKIALRRELPRYRCDRCMNKALNGLNVGQADLFDG